MLKCVFFCCALIHLFQQTKKRGESTAIVAANNNNDKSNAFIVCGFWCRLPQPIRAYEWVILISTRYTEQQQRMNHNNSDISISRQSHVWHETTGERMRERGERATRKQKCWKWNWAECTPHRRNDPEKRPMKRKGKENAKPHDDNNNDIH